MKIWGEDGDTAYYNHAILITGLTGIATMLPSLYFYQKDRRARMIGGLIRPGIIEGKEMNLIGDRLRVLRKKHHLSQQQLSERLETQAVYICRGSISRIEDKSRTVTDIELMGLAKVLGVKIQDLFE